MLRWFCFFAMMLPGAVVADVPKVAVDIAPVHSLVARVMQGVGTPDLVLPPGASPHGHAMRPSEARALQQAELVVWVGPQLTPWLERSIQTLAGEAQVLGLLEHPKTETVPMRDNALFEAHEGHEHDHDHEGADPHAWLDPYNAQAWVGLIAASLSQIDPDNAAIYARNAAEASDELIALSSEIKKIIHTDKARKLIVFHDAYHYFEDRFDMPVLGAIALSDATPPSPAQLSEIRALLTDLGKVCVFAEPQFNADVIASVSSGLSVQTLVLDPVGSKLEPSPTMYSELMIGLAETIAECTP